MFIAVEGFTKPEGNKGKKECRLLTQDLLALRYKFKGSRVTSHGGPLECVLDLRYLGEPLKYDPATVTPMDVPQVNLSQNW